MNKSHKSLKKVFVLLSATTLLFTSAFPVFAISNSTHSTIVSTTTSSINLGDVEVVDFTLDFTGKSEWTYDGVEFSGGTASGKSETWNWNSSTKTLTLGDFAFATSADVAVILPESSTIVLKALTNNMIASTSDAQSNDSYGIYAPDGDLTIQGQGLSTNQGHLSVASGRVDNHYDVSTSAICVENGGLTIDNASVVAQAGEIVTIKTTTTAFSTGIGVYKDDINSKSTSGSNAEFVIKNDSYVEILPSNGDKDAGLRLVDTNVTVRDSYFMTDGNAFGMYSLGNNPTTVNFIDSYVEALANGYDGMYLQNVSNLTVTGAKVVAKGGNQADSCGINIIDANMNFNDATIEAIGTMYGVSSLKNPKTENMDNRYIKITGGVLIAKGGTVAFKTDVDDAKLTISNAEVTVKDDLGLYTNAAELEDNPKDIKIYKRSEYDITFDLNYENSPTGETIRTDDKTISDIYLKAPTRTGYVFDGWYLKSDNSSVTSTTEFEKDTTVYARWAMKAIEVTFEPVGGTVSSLDKVKTTQADGTIVALPDAAKTNSELIGWFLSKETPENGADVQVDTNTIFTEDTTVYARYQDLFVISFNPTEGAVLKSADTTNIDNTMNEFPIAKREDHAFAGWYTSRSGGDMVTNDTEFNSNTTVYAQWIEDEYTIILDPNYSEGYLSSVPTQDHSLTAIPELDREEYKMVALYDSPSGGNKVTTSTVFDQNTTLYASWVVDNTPLGCSITFDSQGGSMGTIVIDTGLSNVVDDYPIPQRDGYAFEGWYTSPSGGDKVITSTVFDDNTVVYAQWTGGESSSTSDSTSSSQPSTSAPSVSEQLIYSRDIPTMIGLYIEEFQNVVPGDYVSNLGSVDPKREDLGTFIGWYHGVDMSTPVSVSELDSMLVTDSILNNGIYPLFEAKRIITESTVVPVTTSNTLNQLF